MLEQDIYRIKREIQIHGEQFSVFCEECNAEGEPTGEKEEKASFRGLFHISKGFSTMSVSDATVTHQKGEPMILCLWGDVENIKREHFLYKNKKRYVITDINDVGGYGEIADISLEVVIDGGEEY